MLLQALYETNVVACIWLLQNLIADSSGDALRRLMFDTDDELTRSMLTGIVSLALSVIGKHELAAFGHDALVTPAPTGA